MSKRAIAISFPFLAIATALDLANHLDIIGPHDQYGFTPFDHGVFGTSVKILLFAASLYSLYVLLSYGVKRKPLALLLTIMVALILVIAGVFILVSAFWTF